MAININTKPGFILEQMHQMQIETFMTALERLSGGKRINSAADDAAGLAVLSN